MLTQAAGAGKPFDLILVDSDMPVADGFSLVRWIKTKKEIICNILMMLTSLRNRSQVDLNDLNVKGMVTKPVRPSDLLDAIIGAVNAGDSMAESADTAPCQSTKSRTGPLNILVAEDTLFNQKFIRRLLDRWGYKATIVENGQAAVSAVSQNHFDIVLMDVQMPEMDGFEATEKIREMESTTAKNVPIIAMTAHAMKGDRERCLEAGMDDYVPKPISSETLLNAINALADQHPVGNTMSNAEDEKESPEAPILDREALLKAFDNDWDFFLEVVVMFVADYPQMMTDIKQAIDQQDPSKLERTAHALKGMLGNFQVASSVEKAFTLEKLGRNETFDNAADTYDSLADELSRLEEVFVNMSQENSN
jgi:CheY-like chemotaxis protein/HPt (histidine-containing phosphotransfer) domain-containing protein